jgi:uncharacterized protein with ParB-like and HNH nuclease domain
MAYETPITIKKVINNIRKRHYVLPSIQREFVWDTEQIETLFDSLMRDYPISTFLFWRVDKEKVQDFQFYEFLNNYHEKNCRHNRKAELTNDEDVTAILDGQQRMTSIYVALTGTFSKKLPYLRRDSKSAYPPKKLYLNLLKPSDELEIEYNFKFLTEQEAESKEEKFWFLCADILDFNDTTAVMSYLMEQGLTDSSKFPTECTKFALRSLTEFHNVIHQKGTISAYLEESEDLDKVLQIFIRINSGGTKLSYSDLLLSIATAQWGDKDAREEIHAFVDEINRIGDGFSFTKDNILKACLVLEDFDVKFKSDNFTKENMKKIENNWEFISESIRASVELISHIGYCKDNLLSTNIIVPIAHFIYKNKCAEKILHSKDHKEDRNSIKEWLARVTLKGTFSSSTDGIYPVLREIINNNIGKFPLAEIFEHYKGRSRSLIVSEDDIENILDLKYGKPKSYAALTLICPGLNYTHKYQQDHIHPQSAFKKKNLRKIGLSEDEINLYIEQCNLLPNIQLLHGTTNTEKSDKPFTEWLVENYQDDVGKNNFLTQNHIRTDQSLDFKDFLGFMEIRRATLKEQLIKVLNVSTKTGALEFEA